MNQQNMPQIEAKNLTVIQDQLSHEALACKKANNYASRFVDPNLKNLASTVAGHHRQQFDRLYQYLNSHQ